MKRHPLLMKGPLVLASMAGNKNQTRRLDGLEKVNENPDWYSYPKLMDGMLRMIKKTYRVTTRILEVPAFPSGTWLFYGKQGTPAAGQTVAVQQWHHAVPGDSIWIRETFNWQEDDRDGYNDGWVYRAGHPYPDEWKWKPSLHMPYNACRLEYPIVSIRPERLMNISWDDSVNEGIEDTGLVSGLRTWRNYMKLAGDDGSVWLDPISSFQSLWQSVYGEEATGRNPWVWRIEYDPSKNLKELLSL